MKLAILGGSFNPIHAGHLALASEVLALGYDKILFVPAAMAPHKEMAFPLAPEKRLRMVQLAVEDNPAFEAESCEINRGGTSYTFDTVTYLEEKYSDILEDKIGLIIGTDQFATFHLWKNAKELSERCTLILGVRPEQKEDNNFKNKSTGKYAEYENSACRDFHVEDEPLFKNAVFLKNAPVSVSSTEIRTMAATGKDFSSLVPEKVFKYIMDGNIYGKKYR